MSAAAGIHWLRVRLYAAAVLLSALFGALLYKAWTVQVRDGERMRALGRAQWHRELSIPPPRGTIRDANGVELAVVVDVPSAYAHPRDVVDVAGSAQRVARALGLDVREVEAKLASPRQFEWLKRRVSPEEAKKIKDLDLPGVGLAQEPRRFYPARMLAGTVLGFAGMDGNGLEGVELSLDDALRGTAAHLPVIRDRRGELVWVEPPAPAAGAAVTLTLDRFIQFSAERALADALREHQARAGMVVVLDPRDGAVLAMAASPGLDPNDPRKRGEARNRPVTDAYEPGSVMKAFSVAAAVEAGVVAPTDQIDVEGGKLQIGRRTIRDTHQGESLLTVNEIVKFSSNVGAVKIARKLGRERLAASLRRLGFGRRTGIELPGERAGVVHDPKRWGEAGLATISYGYGLMVTPLQLAAALVPIANGGTYYPPRLVKKVVAGDGTLMREHRPQGERVLSPSTAAAMAAMLRTVLEAGGTAASVKVPGFVAAGKTGTSYQRDPQTKRYSSDRYLSSFIGFAPADDPRLVIAVMIDEPRGAEHYGGLVAGPVFGRIAEECLRYLGVAGDPVDPEPHTAAPPSEPPPAPVPEPVPDSDPGDLPPAGPGEPIVMVPDFQGMSVGQALAAARDAGVKLEVRGSGRALEQEPPPGRAMKSITCVVTFDPG